jgi:histidinol-phosphatase
VIVREAGGRFTSLAGRDGPAGGNALASNGILHETVLGFLGSVGPDRPRPPAAPQPPRASGETRTQGTVSDLDARRRAQAERVGPPAGDGPDLPPLGM